MIAFFSKMKNLFLGSTSIEQNSSHAFLWEGTDKPILSFTKEIAAKSDHLPCLLKLLYSRNLEATKPEGLN
jgi:hypothetical protein